MNKNVDIPFIPAFPSACFCTETDMQPQVLDKKRQCDRTILHMINFVVSQADSVFWAFLAATVGSSPCSQVICFCVIKYVFVGTIGFSIHATAPSEISRMITPFWRKECLSTCLVLVSWLMKLLNQSYLRSHALTNFWEVTLVRQSKDDTIRDEDNTDKSKSLS